MLKFILIVLAFLLQRSFKCGATTDSCNNSLVAIGVQLDGIQRWDFDTDLADANFDPVDLYQPKALDVDETNGLLFFADVATSILYRKTYYPVPENAYEIMRFQPGSVVEGIAVASLQEILFYTDFAKGLIASVDYEGKNYRAIMTDGLYNPRAIKTDGENSLIYYTDCGEGNQKIAKVSFDGTNHTILEDKNLFSPNGLTADFTYGKLYWCDGSDSTINEMGTDGTGRRTTYRPNTYFPFYDITLIQGTLHVSMWKTAEFTSRILLVHPETNFIKLIVAIPNGNLTRFRRICYPAQVDFSTGSQTTTISSSVPMNPENSIRPIIIAVAVSSGAIVVTAIIITVICMTRRKQTQHDNADSSQPEPQSNPWLSNMIQLTQQYINPINVTSPTCDSMSYRNVEFAYQYIKPVNQTSPTRDSNTTSLYDTITIDSEYITQ